MICTIGGCRRLLYAIRNQLMFIPMYVLLGVWIHFDLGAWGWEYEVRGEMGVKYKVRKKSNSISSFSGWNTYLRMHVAYLHAYFKEEENYLFRFACPCRSHGCRYDSSKTW